MSYNADRPIYTEEQDLLGRASFSNQLGEAIYQHKEKDGLVIGLFGKWGSGKTSIINMAINKINELAKTDEKKPLIMKFAPWNHSNKDNLISMFFQQLKSKINLEDNQELKNTVGKALNDYAGLFDLLTFIPVLGSGLAGAFKTIAQAQGANLMQNVDLEKTKNILESELIKVNAKIIIVIDDIDRLTNSQIRDVFQLVKQVADFPNVIYVLAMERKVVRSALSEVHNIDGNEYLEKIIQVPFELPELKIDKLNNIFFSKLETVINGLPDKVVWAKDYWNNIFLNCIKPYIKTLRDVNRIINIFQFRYGMVYQETAFEDMLALCTIEVLEPELYKWICNKKDDISGELMYEYLSTRSNEQDYAKLYYEEFENLGIEPDLAINFVSTMFPVFARKVNKHQHLYQSNSDIRAKMRAAHTAKFDLYFMFDLSDIKVSRNIINDCIYEYDKENLTKLIKDINKQGNISYLLEEINSLVDQIPYKRLNLISSVILSLQGELIDENPKDILKIPVSYRSAFLVTSIIKKLKTEKEKYETISSALKNIETTSLGEMARFINNIERAHGRLGSNSKEQNEQIISISNLKKLEQIYVEKIQSIAVSEKLLNVKGFSMIFYLWKCFDEVGAKSYLKGLFKDKLNKLRFICAIASRWDGTDGGGWRFYSEQYSEHIKQDEAYNMIINLDKRKLNEFTDVEQIKLASFVLSYTKLADKHINEEDALKLLNKWKKKKSNSKEA